MNETFMKEKPVFPLIVSMSLPMVISMLVNSLYNIVDSFFVAQISEDAMTALSLVYPVQNFVNAIAIGFGVGISSQISLYLGAGDSAIPTVMTLVGVCLLRIVWLAAVLPQHHTMTAVLLTYPITWIITSFMFIVYYFRGGWLKRCIRRAGLSPEEQA